jgi:hypothetical protein
MKSRVIPIMLSIMMVSALVGASWTTTNYEFTPKYDADTTFGVITNNSDDLKIRQRSGFNPDTFGLMSFNISTIDDTYVPLSSLCNIRCFFKLYK